MPIPPGKTRQEGELGALLACCGVILWCVALQPDGLVDNGRIKTVLGGT
jgi:hypothetical protein